MKLTEVLDEIRNPNDKIKKVYRLLQYYDEQSRAIPGPMYDEDRIDKTRSLKAPFEIWVCKKLDKQKEIELEEAQLKELKLRAVTALESLTNQDYAMVNIYRHLCFMTYKEIMCKLHLSRSSTYRLYDEAWSAIEEICV